MSQEALAEQLGVERTTIACWESGGTQPLAWFRPRVADVLRVSVDDLDVMIRNVEEQNLEVNYGPVGAGIEVMTYVADRFRHSGFRMTAA